MKIKNLKINKNITSKLATYILIGSLSVTTLTGCNTPDRNNILKGTILENTCVVTFNNGTKDIAIAINACNNSEYAHYYSVISGEYFCDKACPQKLIEGYVTHKHEITSVENITNYLTSEELTKAIKGELNKEDIVNIVSKTITPINKETKIKTK